MQKRLNGEREYIPEEIESVLKQTDYYSYVAELVDNWNCIGNDVIDECEEQIDYIENTKRINKETIRKGFEKNK